MPVRVHLTNLAGLGAVQLASSLLPAIEASPGYYLDTLYLPNCGPLADYKPSKTGTTVVKWRRVLSNSLSRLIECLASPQIFSGQAPLLVLGDLPLRCKCRQIVFVQTPLLTGHSRSTSHLDELKYVIARLIFRINLRYAASYIVQTAVMKHSLEETYPALKGRIVVVGQPVPMWLIKSRLHRTGREQPKGSKLHLFYPAGVYPHKNHSLLSDIREADVMDWPIASLILTIAKTEDSFANFPWIRFAGFLQPEEMIRVYSSVDALIFLSYAESYGFPLVEAMWVGLPIVCPDLPYARVLCGDQAIYFNPGDIDSLMKGVIELQVRLESGWWPDWSGALESVPNGWDEVASKMLSVCGQS